MIGARSTTGCWTCRIRKKKCDEIHPICNSCSMRNLTCFGYEEKPYWMDGGEIKEREVAKIQQAARQSYSLRRAVRAKGARGAKDPVLLELVKGGHLTLALEELPLEPAHSSYVALPTSSDLATKRILSTLILNNEYTSFLQGPQDLVVDRSTGDEYSEPVISNVSDVAEELDPVKIMYYFDNVFPLQHHFYRPSTPDAGRGWLLNLLLRNKCLYLSALAMNALHQNLFRDIGNADNERRSMRELEWYHSRTINELRHEVKHLSTLNGLDHLKSGVPILASMIQLVSFEVLREYKHFKGNRGDWEVHLEGAGALISLLNNHITETRRQTEESRFKSQSHSTTNSTPNDSLPVPDIYPPEDITGFDFLSTVYVWADILRCGSIGWRGLTTFEIPYERCVQEERFQLGPEMGCSNWAMLSIIKIARLEAWIDESRTSEACQQAALIEDCLKGSRAALSQKPETPIPYEKDRRLVTEIYGLSALIYLYIVISAVVPTPPELVACISKSLAALQAITPDRLVAVSWPFCVAGCMAVGHERDAFRQIVLSAIQSGTKIGTTRVALEIVEECWRLRWHPNNLQVNGVCWWRASMQSLEFKTLLI